MKRIISILLSIAISNSATAAEIKLLNLVCPIEKQYVCSIDGCKKNTPSVTIKVQQVESGRIYYSRCDKKGCDKYESSMAQPSALIEIFPIDGNSSRLKISYEDMTFMETVSLFLNSFAGFGKCHKVTQDE